MTDTAPGGIAAARDHLEAAMAALGVRAPAEGDWEIDREAARKVHAAEPGVPAAHALATIQVLRARGWKPGEP